MADSTLMFFLDSIGCRALPGSAFATVLIFFTGSGKMVDFQFQFSGLNRSHMRDLGASVGGFFVKFRRAHFFDFQKNPKMSNFPNFEEKIKFGIFRKIG